MADTKLSDLTELTAPASDDEFLVLDTSESVAADKNKRISYGTLLTEIPAGSVTAPLQMQRHRPVQSCLSIVASSRQR